MLIKYTFLKKNLMVKKNPFKHYIGYDNHNYMRLLCIKFPQMIGCVKHFDSNKTMLLKDSDKKLLKKYTTIWERGISLMNIKFDSKPVYGDNGKYIKAKIRSYRDKVNTNF